MNKVFSLYPFKDSPASRKKARRSWDIVCGLTGLLIVCSVLICFREPYEIGEPTMHGFPLWFLVFLAYPVLLLLSVFNVIFRLDDSMLVNYVVFNNQAIGLGVIDLLTLLAIWAVVRFGMLRFFGSRWVQVASNFMLLVAGWGIAQLFYFLMVFLWNSGGFEPLHHHLEDPQPEPKNVIVVADDAPASNLELQHRKYEMKKQNKSL
jgi:hypothetical protein